LTQFAIFTYNVQNQYLLSSKEREMRKASIFISGLVMSIVLMPAKVWGSIYHSLCISNVNTGGTGTVTKVGGSCSYLQDAWKHSLHNRQLAAGFFCWQYTGGRSCNQSIVNIGATALLMQDNLMEGWACLDNNTPSIGAVVNQNSLYSSNVGPGGNCFCFVPRVGAIRVHSYNNVGSCIDGNLSPSCVSRCGNPQNFAASQINTDNAVRVFEMTPTANQNISGLRGTPTTASSNTFGNCPGEHVFAWEAIQVPSANSNLNNTEFRAGSTYFNIVCTPT
jgi:hypothetical protein